MKNYSIGLAGMSLVAGLLGLFSVLDTSAFPAEISSIVVLSKPPGTAAVPSAVIDEEGILHAVWSEGRRGRFDILYRRVDRQPPGPAIRISDTPGISSGPKIVRAPNGRLFMIWHDSTPPRTRLYLQSIERNGGPTAAASMITPETKGAFTPSMAFDNRNRLHVAWAERAPDNFEIFYRPLEAKTAAGARLNLSANRGRSLVPAVATDPCDRVYIAWHDNTAGSFDVYLRASEDGGRTFGALKNVSASPGLSGAPALIAPSCDTLYVFWPDTTPGNFEVFARRSIDGGQTFGPVENLSSTASISIRPAVTSDRSGTLHLTWIDGEPDRFQVFYRCIAPDLGSSSVPIRISSNRGLAGAPTIAVNAGGDAQIVWVENDGGPFTAFARTASKCQPR